MDQQGKSQSAIMGNQEKKGSCLGLGESSEISPSTCILASSTRNWSSCS